jgi:eukaryotic-like serine/threonine-protein kinase
MVGKTIGAYRILSLLGAGGMGQVYLAEDTRLSRKLALKVLAAEVASDQQRMRRFVQEARAASALSHANIAHTYELGEIEGRPFIAMEYVEGQTLSAKINRHPMSLTEIIQISLQVADALDEAHGKGITHRDIKAGNIMITPRGQVKVLDFGLAKIDKSREVVGDASTLLSTASGLLMGTISYMSPEQALGRDVDHRTDIFSLGVVMYEMATGCLPFSGGSAGETIERIVHAHPEAIARLNYSISAELERIVRKCMEKERERRYQSARDLVVDLRNWDRDTKKSERPAPQSRKHSRKSIDSLAVLPIENSSADPEMDYLSEGITGSIINSLAQLPKLHVMSQGTTFRYKGREFDPQQIGRDLAVRAVLMGRILQRGGRVFISAELVDTSDGCHLWGAQYTCPFSDIFAVQEEIAGEVIANLRLKLTGEDKRKLVKRHTADIHAYQLYLKGRYFWNKTTQEGARRGIEYFQQAIDRDPGYALAYAGLADCYSLLSTLGTLPPKELLTKAKAAALKALKLDETIAEAHTALGFVKLIYEWDWGGVETEFKKAIELNSNDDWVHQAYGLYLAATGRFDESVAEMKRAHEMDPLTPASNMIGMPFYYARQFDEAIGQFRKALEMDPNFPNTRFRLGLAYAQKKMYEGAISEFQRALQFSRDSDAEAALGHVYAILGNKDEAKAVLAELKKKAEAEYVPSYDVAIIHIALGETHEAFEWLERAFEERCYWLIYLKVDPILDTLRSDPRLTDLIRRVGL